MMEGGLINEVEKLIEMGYDKSTIAMQGIGYKEILSYLRNEISLQEAIELIKKGTRNYAKRQMTWFKRIENVPDFMKATASECMKPGHFSFQFVLSCFIPEETLEHI
jgi:tRNA A37 N6-isopentenylltransferase MiaA